MTVGPGQRLRLTENVASKALWDFSHNFKGTLSIRILRAARICCVSRLVPERLVIPSGIICLASYPPEIGVIVENRHDKVKCNIEIVLKATLGRLIVSYEKTARVGANVVSRPVLW